MSTSSNNLRGIALMVLATGMFVANDTFMKMTTEVLPPLQVLFIRGVTATIWCVPLLFVTGIIRDIRHFTNPWIVLRSVVETAAVCLFVVSLANMPIADITSLGQLAPMMMLLFLSLFFRERVGLNRLLLIGVGFAGAILVAQPGGEGFSIFAVLGFFQALLTGIRDTLLRKVPPAAPSMILAFSAIVIVMIGAGAAHLTFETWVAPEGGHILLLVGSGLFLMIAHISITAAYRMGEAGVIAPFYYTAAIWAVVSGYFVFSTLPNTLALAGIALILVSGVTVAILDERKRRRLVPLT
jgi:drug/metabolite transporter (DMT)-like permease